LIETDGATPEAHRDACTPRACRLVNDDGRVDFFKFPCRRRVYPNVLREQAGDDPIVYAILCYNDEDVDLPWRQEEDGPVRARLDAVQDRLGNARKVGPSLRFLPTTSATTLRKTQGPPLVIDGPFAETKEQLLGFYVIDVADLEEALTVARELAAANPGGA